MKGRQGLEKILRTRLARVERVLLAAERWLLSRAPRERYLVFVGGFLVIATAWYIFFYVPGQDAVAENRAAVSNVTEQTEVIREQRKALEAEREAIPEPDAQVRARIEALEREIETLTGGDQSGQLANITDMAPVPAINTIQSTVNAAPGVRLTRFYRQPGPGAGESSDDDQTAPIVHRRMEVAFESTYRQTLALVERLEGLDIPIIWRSVDYSVNEHPKASVTMRFDIYATSNAR